MLGPATQKDTLDGLFAEILSLERQHASKRRSRTIAHHLQPLVAFVERYAAAVDVAVQGTLNPAALVWGLLRALLVVAKSYTRYFDRVVSTLERLGFIVSVCSQYEGIIGQSLAFRECVSLVYSDVIIFLQKAKKVFRKSGTSPVNNEKGITIFAQSIWRDFEAEFQETLGALTIHIEALRDQATVSFRKGFYDSTSEILRKLECPPGRDQKEGLLRWLSPVPSHETLAYSTAKKLAPCGQWLIATPAFDIWRRSASGLLWIHALPGTGKTILSTSIIEEISKSIEDAEGICYFFCRNSDPSRSTIQSICASLVFQLIEHLKDIPPSIVSTYERASRFGRPHISESENSLDLLKAAATSYRKVYIVLDGLDESPEASKAAATFSRIVQVLTNVSIIILSRDVPEVRKHLEEFSELRITSAQTEGDLKTYIAHAVAGLGLAFGDSELEGKTVQALQSASDGVFLWASLMIDSLRSATTPQQLAITLSHLPTGLSGIYTERLRRVFLQGSAQSEIFKRVASWALCSLRPMTLTEIRTSLVVNMTRATFEPSQKPFPGLVLQICSAFFAMEPSTGLMRPVHASVNDFLLHLESRQQVDNDLKSFFTNKNLCHQRIAQECMVLLEAAFDFRRVIDGAVNEPLTRYACLSWLDHVIQSSFDEPIYESVVNFLRSGYRRQWIMYFLLWQREVFPLHKLFHLQRNFKAWAGLAPGLETPNHLDWALDVATILLDLSQTTLKLAAEDDVLRASASVCGVENLSHFERMMIIRDLARNLTQTGRLSHGIHLFESASEEQYNQDGSTEHDSTWLLNVLGILYDQQGETVKAVKAQEDALLVLSRDSTIVTRELIWTKNELGRMYRHQKRFMDAERMHVEALQELENVNGDKAIDLEIAWTRSTLARVYRNQARFEESISYANRALEIRRLALGIEHPHCLWLLGDIGQCYHEKGEYDTAIRYHREAYESRRRVLGEEHPDTLWTMNNLAVVLAKTSDENKIQALQLQRTAFTTQRRVLGEEHPHTKWTAAILGASSGA